ncbi:NAD(P)-dependent oxidoreductase [Paenibacillus sp. CGMCC 1.16610]|uniref:NAD-dependent epimerase/dehydratase family protein n=1 Tax=Paenibacillus anseongense TaxID=2682845 RepID=A0ABW9U3I0_9BACL|nr:MULTISPECIES: NAD(P)-dependent oxidoreductase [Paenibacillus]MBA2938681.1 NAD(P)-dependent oxidoreductase [Paenibacillus sp. CGMCC 1.16610]MVQ34644.1 NAD-dependent epimerase/dehydratase family protein [Paenibacillus anseongense]
MNIFVTGASGKIGSRFVPRLLQRGHNVSVLLRNRAKAGMLDQHGARVVEGDLLQPESFASTLRGNDVVIHLAAQFRGVNQETAQKSNIDASILLAEAALRADVPRFVFASTNLVYGSGNTSGPSQENDLLQPAFTYPQTKKIAEEALFQLHREKGLGLRILRFAFVYGENDPHITEYMPMMSKWQPAKRLHMIHHADVSQALLLAASTPGIDGRIYNVADDSPITAYELFQLYHQSDRLEGEAAQQHFNPWDMIVDTTRIREELNYRPNYPSFYTARDAGAL